jgi:hypothetical protein
MIPDLNNKAEIEKIINSVDPTARLWDFTAPWLRYKRREYDFGSENLIISIVDPFKGLIPSLTSSETLKGGMPRLSYTIILDSNVMASLDRFVVNPNKLSHDHKKVMVQLLDYFIHENVDYSPAFYYYESLSKSTLGNSAIVDYTRSILQLHMMDELHFLKRREIRPDKEALEYYTAKFGTSDLYEMANQQYHYVRNRFSSNNDWKVMYLILLKTALIQKSYRADFQYKMNLLNEFIYSVFGALFAEELSIAAFYFSGKLDKFIPLQRGANFSSVLNKLKATAWDLYLLRLPQIFLCNEESPIPLAAICTGDKSIQYIGRKFRVRKLYSSQGKPFPELETDFSDINGSSDSESPLIKLFHEFQEQREARRRYLDMDEVLNGIDHVIQEIESEVKGFCTED